VQHASLRQYSKIKMLLKDARRRFVLFNNENFAETFAARKDGESTIERNRRAMFDAVKWYCLHFIEIEATSKPLVFVTDDPELNGMCSHLPHVNVMSSGDYVKRFPFSKSFLELYDSLNQVFLQQKELNVSQRSQKKVNPQGNLWEEYLPQEVLDAGVKSMNLFRGSLTVSKFNLDDATIRLDGSHGVLTEIYVPKQYRNRAFHGDSVVAQLLPESQWTGPSKYFKKNQDEKKRSSTDSNQSSHREDCGSEKKLATLCLYSST